MRRAALAALLAALALPAAGAAPAQAEPHLAVGLADDRLLLEDPEGAPQLARAWKAAGVDVVRIHARWLGLAPAGDARRRPAGFDAADPRDPAYTFGYLDSAVRAVVDAGLEPLLAITGSGPLWATADPASGNHRLRPDAREFGRFAGAVARRYAGLVDRYIVWNEPNQPGWLQPQWRCAAGGCDPVAPHLYRRLLAAAGPAIRAADPGAQLLAGALAPRGGAPRGSGTPMRPLTFLRAMACVDRALRPVSTGPCRDFRPPRLTALAHHPHGVFRAPDQPNPHPDEAAMADLDRLTALVDRLQDLGRLEVDGGRRAPLHLTEFGYQTSPPDPFSGVPLASQAAWLQQAGWVAHRHPRVASLVHYQWEDEPVSDKGGGARSFSGWQSGLFTVRGRPKPALRAFLHPIWVADRGAGRAEVWGQVRPGGRWRIRVQRQDPGGPWRNADLLQTDRRGAFVLRVASGPRTRWRYRFTAPADGSSSPRKVVSAAMVPDPRR